MTDLYLKFSDKAQADALLFHEQEGKQVGNFKNLDVIGLIYEHQVITDIENPPTPIALEGWHVNVRLVDGEDGTALLPFAIVPKNPRRVWG